MKKKGLFTIVALFLITFNFIIYLMSDRIVGFGSKNAILFVNVMAIALCFFINAVIDMRLDLPVLVITVVYIAVLIAFVFILNKVEKKPAIIIHTVAAFLYLVVFFALRNNNKTIEKKIASQNKNYSFIRDNYSVLSSINFSSVDDSTKEKINQLSWLIKTSPSTVSAEKRKYDQRITLIINRILEDINKLDSEEIAKSIEEAKSLLSLRNH